MYMYVRSMYMYVRSVYTHVSHLHILVTTGIDSGILCGKGWVGG